MKLTLQFTRDYDKFVFKADNRDTKDSRAHIRDLMESMKKHGFIKSKAISVRKVPGTSKFEILDGQHRFLAAKELGIAIWFSVDDEISDEALPDLQIAKKWLPKDYLKHFIVKGKKEYIELGEIYSKHPTVSITTIVLLLIGGISEDQYRHHFETGTMKITHLKQTLKALDLAEDLYKKHKHGWLHSRTFLSAFIQILALPEYEHKIMLHKLTMRSEEFVQMMSEEGYFKMFDKIYNYKAVTNRIAFTYTLRPKSKAGRSKKDEE